MGEIFIHKVANAVLKVTSEKELENYKTPERTNMFIFICSQDKEVRLSLDYVPITIPPHHILAITPPQQLQYFSGTNVAVYMFNEEFYCIKDHDQEVGCTGLLFFGSSQLPLIPLNFEEQKQYSMLRQVFLSEIEQENDTIQVEMLRILMSLFIIKTTRLLKNHIDTTHLTKNRHDLLQKYKVLVDSYFRKEHSVSFYAELLNKSPKTLSNSFGKLKKSPIKIIHERITLEAKRLLIYTERTAKEIAFELGFEDASHLSRMFKKTNRVIPYFL